LLSLSELLWLVGKPEDEKKQNLYRAYNRFVTKEFSRVEGIIKLLITPPDRIISAFKSLLPKGNCSFKHGFVASVSHGSDLQF